MPRWFVQPGNETPDAVSQVGVAAVRAEAVEIIRSVPIMSINGIAPRRWDAL
jgi:hypothetical protein